MTHSRSAGRAATLILATVALLLFARLAVRHVGESYFLADQVDQLQKYEAALRLEPEGLWGGAMSGTAARALGPAGALAFGLPVSLGLGIDAIHALTSVLLILATAIAFWQLLRLNLVLGWTWLIVFTAMRMVWWNAAMFWVNTLLLPLGLLLLALFVSSLRRPSAVKVAAAVLVLLLALHINLVASVAAALPAILAGRLLVARQRTGAPSDPALSRRAAVSPALVLVLGLIAAALLPYLVAEATTRFRNTRAMFAHVESAAHAGGDAGRRAAADTVMLAADPVGIFPGRPATAGAAAVIVTAAALALLLGTRRRAVPPAVRWEARAMAWLVFTTVVAVTGQALFFLVMARPLNGLHYAMVLAPWYPVPLAALAAAALTLLRRPSPYVISSVFGLAAVVLLVVRAPGLADRAVEPTPWTYRAIVTALATLCDGQAVATLEGPGLVNDLTPSSDSVLQYLLKRGFTSCRYDPNAAIVIAADRSGSFAEEVELAGLRFRRQRVLPPGLARYQRAP